MRSLRSHGDRGQAEGGLFFFPLDLVDVLDDLEDELDLEPELFIFFFPPSVSVCRLRGFSLSIFSNTSESSTARVL